MLGNGLMAQLLVVLASLSADPVLVPSTYTPKIGWLLAVCNLVPEGRGPSFGLCGHLAHIWYTYMKTKHLKHTHTFFKERQQPLLFRELLGPP